MVQSYRVCVFNERVIIFRKYDVITTYQIGVLAQLVERVLSMHKVAGLFQYSLDNGHVRFDISVGRAPD